MRWEQQRVFVTGGGGFIGSHLVERLVQLGAKTKVLLRYNALGHAGWLEHSPYRKEIEIIWGDIRDYDSVLRGIRDCDIVFHLAALISIPYSYQAPELYIQTNVMGTANVLRAARNCSTLSKIILTSTSEVYGTARYVPIDEQHPLQAQSPYSASKIAADKLGESFYLSYNLPITIIRPFNTFGPRQSIRAIIPTIITQVLANSGPIHLGSLTPTRDLNFVYNTVDGFIATAEADSNLITGETINLGSGQEISIGDLAKTILRLMGTHRDIITDEQRVRPEKSEVERLLADSSKAKRLLQWKPKISFEEGLHQTIQWYQNPNNQKLFPSEPLWYS